MQERTSTIAGLVYESVRGVTRLVGGTNDAILAQLVPILDESSSRERALELIARPELDRRQSQGQPFGGYRQAGVHQNAADGVVQRATFFVLAHIRLV